MTSKNGIFQDQLDQHSCVEFQGDSYGSGFGAW